MTGKKVQLRSGESRRSRPRPSTSARAAVCDQPTVDAQALDLPEVHRGQKHSNHPLLPKSAEQHTSHSHSPFNSGISSPHQEQARQRSRLP